MAKMVWHDPKIEVGGVDVSSFVTGVTIDAKPGNLHRVVLELYGDGVTINGKTVDQIMRRAE